MAPVTATLLTYGAALAGAVLAIVFDAFGMRRAAVAFGAAGLAGAAAVPAASVPLKSTSVWSVLRVGHLTSTMAAIIMVLAAMALIGGWGHLTRREHGGSLAGLVCFGAAASVLVAQTTDLTMLLIGLETAAACGYALVSSGGMRGSREAALKYFVQGAIATAFFVLGLAVVVAVFAPNAGIEALPKILADDVARSSALAALVMLIAALAFKAGAVPFHSWAPDAYENASPSSSAFLSSGPKIAAITALAILVSITSVAAITVPIQAALTLLAVLSILVGSVTALRQTSYTRMLGYAGVAQVGYALVAIATISRPVLATFFIASYALASTASFLAADAFRSVRPDWDGTIEGLSGIGREAPVLGVAASVTLISLAGIPPLIGFWGKFTVFYSAALGGLLGLTAGNSLSAWLALAAAVAGIVGSIVSLGYYGAVLRALFAPAPGDEGDDSRARARAGSAGLAVAVLAIAIVATGLIPLDTGIDWVVRLFS